MNVSGNMKGVNPMKKISLRTQKIVMFIPYINCINLFIWVNNFFCMKYSNRIAAKSILIILTSILPLLFLEITVSRLFPELEKIITLLGSYFLPLLMGLGLIKFQQTLEK